MALSNQSELPAFSSPWKVNLKIPINSGLQQAGIRRCFRLLVSSNPHLRFRLVVSRDLANLGKSLPGILQFLVSHLPGFGFSRKVIFGIRPIFKLTFRGLKNAGKSLWLDKTIPEILKLLKMSFMLLSWDFIIQILKKTCRASSLLYRIEWA